jgi:hypothetical protein
MFSEEHATKSRVHLTIDDVLDGIAEELYDWHSRHPVIENTQNVSLLYTVYPPFEESLTWLESKTNLSHLK